MNQAAKHWLLHRMSVLLVCLMATCSDSARADGPAPDEETSEFEIDFMTMMIDHHSMAVEMAHLCVGRAVHADLDSLCHDIIAAQSAEIAEMQQWLRDWYGVEYGPQMTREMQRQLHRLHVKHGRAFEIAFMRMMIEHHSIAIEEAEHCTDNAFHEDLMELCENIIATQSEEIQLMRTWLCQWYHICRHHRGGH